jgi:hypothetical protein
VCAFFFQNKNNKYSFLSSQKDIYTMSRYYYFSQEQADWAGSRRRTHKDTGESFVFTESSDEEPTDFFRARKEDNERKPTPWNFTFIKRLTEEEADISWNDKKYQEGSHLQQANQKRLLASLSPYYPNYKWETVVPPAGPAHITAAATSATKAKVFHRICMECHKDNCRFKCNGCDLTFYCNTECQKKIGGFTNMSAKSKSQHSYI